ncbi:response regulator [Flavobacterium sp. N1736]|uniref:response regulator n=1 Tax=Flavobacterium sp. N1736 TaxID=2986823 RepID=UPI0022241DA9|nr:response regulator [Flavobacterium sp. N1736]
MLYQNILLIDDDLEDVEILTEAIESILEKKVCYAATKRAKVIEALENSKIVPDLIFMDLNMPGVNHFELLEQIKSSEIMQQVPIVLYSSHTKEIMQELTKPFKIEHYVTKPTNYQDLITLLTEIFSK